ncbi:MAG: hypothetical protein QOE90_1197 [Thermoplasmata archaeon]|nr:hypothetical protein [Thermoplasmata archaeon]
MRSRPSLALVALAVLAAGCATAPGIDAPASGSHGAALVADPFTADGLASGAWTKGFWYPRADAVEGQASISEGEMRVAVRPGTLSAFGAAHAIEGRADGLVLEAKVRVHTLYRTGVYLAGPTTWAGVELDAEGFCLCANSSSVQWQPTFFGPRPLPEMDYTVRLDLRADGTAEAQVWDDASHLVASVARADVQVRPADVRQVWFGTWMDDASSPPSSASLAWIAAWDRQLTPAQERAILQDLS